MTSVEETFLPDTDSPIGIRLDFGNRSLFVFTWGDQLIATDKLPNYLVEAEPVSDHRAESDTRGKTHWRLICRPPCASPTLSMPSERSVLGSGAVTAKVTANFPSFCGQARTPSDEEGTVSISGGRLWTVVDV